jgi:phosphoribosylaminoimidazole-succinocarboxamide synthase
MSEARIEQAIKGHLHNALFSMESLKPHHRGKVRDIFLKNDRLYMVNTDRISAFDQVLGTIPLKGALLCEQTEYWFNFTKDICKNHYIDRPDPQILVVKKAQALKVEVIVRGYLAGSLMREDPKSRGARYGLSLDPQLKNYAPFEKPIITPTTKADLGHHDEPISKNEIIAQNLVSKQDWEMIEKIALDLFGECQKKAQQNGLLLIDTKYEFGILDGAIHLIDEIHTSDSSRFFIESDYHQKMAHNEAPTMLDKEYLRQRLIALKINPSSPDFSGINLDDELRCEVAKRYFMLTEKITGQHFMPPSLGAHERVHQRMGELIC